VQDASTVDQRSDTFFRRVAEAVEGTPYVVTRTESGFDLTLDYLNARWHGLFSDHRLSRVFTHHVAVKGTDRYTIADDSRAVYWRAGVPTLSAEVERRHGRVFQFGAGKIGTYSGRPVTDWTFASEEGRRIVTTAADGLGLRQRQPATVTIAMVLAVIGGGGALVGLISELVGRL
jgi:hypothetical protein